MMSPHLWLNTGDADDHRPQLLHLNMQPDESFLPETWRQEDLEQSFRNASTGDIAIERISVPLKERALKCIGEYDGVVIGGGSYSVTEDYDFFHEARSTIRNAIDERVPVLGICLGHQLIGQEFGAKVQKGGYGSETGVYTITQTIQGRLNPLLQSLPSRFDSPTNHSDVVTDLPSDAQELAYSNSYGNQAVEYAPNTWGIQFHPERSKRTMAAIFKRKFRGVVLEGILEKLDLMNLSVPQRILTNFMHHVRMTSLKTNPAESTKEPTEVHIAG